MTLTSIYSHDVPSNAISITHKFIELADNDRAAAISLVLDYGEHKPREAAALAQAAGLTAELIMNVPPTSILSQWLDQEAAGGALFIPSVLKPAEALSDDRAMPVGHNDDMTLRGHDVAPEGRSCEQGQRYPGPVGRRVSEYDHYVAKYGPPPGLGNDRPEKPCRESDWFQGGSLTPWGSEVREGVNEPPSNEVISHVVSDEVSPVAKKENMGLPFAGVAPPADLERRNAELEAKWANDDAVNPYRERIGLPRCGFNGDITFARLDFFHNQRTPGRETGKSLYTLKLFYWTERDPALITWQNRKVLFINFTEPKRLTTPKHGFSLDQLNKNNFYASNYEQLRKQWCLVNRKLRKRNIRPVMMGNVELPREFNAENKPMGRRACLEQYAILMLDGDGEPRIEIYDGFSRPSIGMSPPHVIDFTFDRAPRPREANACTHTSYFDVIGYHGYRIKKRKEIKSGYK